MLPVIHIQVQMPNTGITFWTAGMEISLQRLGAAVGHLTRMAHLPAQTVKLLHGTTNQEMQEGIKQ